MAMKIMIKETHFWSDGSNTTRLREVCIDERGPVVVTLRKLSDAEAYIAYLNNETYVYEPNEARRPLYEVEVA